MKRNYLIIIIVFFSNLSSAQYLIEGHISDSALNKVAYLDIIDSWDGFKSISKEMILKKTEIDSLGNYYFKGNELSEQLGYYRIRVVERGMPVVSISQNNTIYFAMTNKDTVSIYGKYIINDLYENLEIMNVSKKIDSLDNLILSAKNTRIQELLIEKKEAFLNTKMQSKSMPLTAMLSAFYKKDRSNDFIENLGEISKKLESTNYRKIYNTSLNQFIGQQNYKKLSQKNKTQSYILVFSLFINIIVVAFFGFNFIKRKRSLKRYKWEGLTNKELEVLELISNKKSNKEMADLLFVSEATVKSHVNNIYRKLDIQSRKQAAKLYQRKKST